MGRKGNVDLAIKKNADASKNATAMIGIFIMNLVLVAAYLIEVLKGARDILFRVSLQLLFIYVRKKRTVSVI